MAAAAMPETNRLYKLEQTPSTLLNLFLESETGC